jgi:hypothetical protein
MSRMVHCVWPGDKFGLWTAIAPVDAIPGRKNRTPGWSLRCECGSIGYSVAAKLTIGLTKSCGCHRGQHVSQNKPRSVPSGPTGSRLRKIYNNIKQRCGNSKNPLYRYYGAVGITLCSEWSAFPAFYQWAIASGYEASLSLDRVDNRKGYSPSNCRWADRITQMNNTSRNRVFEAFGERKTVAQWARDSRCAAGYTTLMTRIKSGWDSERALTVAPHAD